MNLKDYVQFVKERSAIRSDEAAKRAIEAVLQILGQRISPGQAEDIAVMLPPQLKPFLMQTDAPEKFNLPEFLKRISEKEQVSPAVAEEHARAVLSVLAEWIPRAELRNTLAQIPNDMRNLFEWIGCAA